MENLNLALVSSPKPLLLGHSSSKNVFTRRKPLTFGRFCVSANSSSSLVTRAASKSHPNLKSVQGKPTVHTFASISSSNSQETTSVGVSPQLSPPPPSTVGSPLFWIGVGVGFSALFSVVASRLKKYAMQQAFKTMMGQMNTQNNPFESSTFSSGSPFPFPNPSASGPARPAGFAGNQSQATSTRSASQSTVTVDIPATKVEAAAPAPDINVKDEVKVKNEPKKSVSTLFSQVKHLLIHGLKKRLDITTNHYGIFCTCCNAEVSASKFEAHAGWASRRKPYLHIYTFNGVSLHQLSLSLSKYRRFSASDNDDLCSICPDGGDLLCCGGCPRAFHIDV